MKFFNLILISNYLTPHWAYLDDVQNTPVPFHRLYFLCSTPHTLSPRNADPNISSLTQGTLAEVCVKFVPSTSSPDNLCSTKEGTQHAREHDPCSPLPSVFEHSLNYRSKLLNLCIELEHRPLIHGNDTSSPKRYGPTTDLHDENSFCSLPYCKSMKFIETKVPAINCRVLTVF